MALTRIPEIDFKIICHLPPTAGVLCRYIHSLMNDAYYKTKIIRRYGFDVSELNPTASFRHQYTSLPWIDKISAIVLDRPDALHYMRKQGDVDVFVLACCQHSIRVVNWMLPHIVNPAPGLIAAIENNVPDVVSLVLRYVDIPFWTDAIDDAIGKITDDDTYCNIVRRLAEGGFPISDADASYMATKGYPEYLTGRDIPNLQMIYADTGDLEHLKEVASPQDLEELLQRSLLQRQFHVADWIYETYPDETKSLHVITNSPEAFRWSVKHQLVNTETLRFIISLGDIELIRWCAQYVSLPSMYTLSIDIAKVYREITGRVPDTVSLDVSSESIEWAVTHNVPPHGLLGSVDRHDLPQLRKLEKAFPQWDRNVASTKEVGDYKVWEWSGFVPLTTAPISAALHRNDMESILWMINAWGPVSPVLCARLTSLSTFRDLLTIHPYLMPSQDDVDLLALFSCVDVIRWLTQQGIYVSSKTIETIAYQGNTDMLQAMEADVRAIDLARINNEQTFIWCVDNGAIVNTDARRHFATIATTQEFLNTIMVGDEKINPLTSSLATLTWMHSRRELHLPSVTSRMIAQRCCPVSIQWAMRTLGIDTSEDSTIQIKDFIEYIEGQSI